MKPLTFAEARNNQRGNPAATWFGPPGRATSLQYAFERVGHEFFVPYCVPRFELPAEGAYFMIGSCFARGLETVLAANKYDVRSLSTEFEQFESTGVGGSALGATNRYNTASILNEFRWALDPTAFFPDEAIVDIDDRVCFDPHMNPTLKLADRTETARRRSLYTEVMREAMNSDAVIITLGLVEAWFDTRLGLVMNFAPDPRVVRQDPDRFIFKRLSHAENLENLEAVHALLQRYGKPGHKIVVTVSPVPLMTTFTTDDVVVANNYSKATLRSVATEFSAMHSNVDYFPSYEIVMNSSSEMAWVEDKRHVRGPFAIQIMKFFIKNWIADEKNVAVVDADLADVY